MNDRIPIPSRPWRRTGAGVAAAFLALSGIGQAAAHASLTRATIRPGEVFTLHHPSPRTLTAVFAENVSPRRSFVHVFAGDPRGDHGAVDLGNVRFPFKDPKEITVGLPARLPKGPYIVMWYAVSVDDGHAAGATFTFTIT
jgi:copper transport protein